MAIVRVYVYIYIYRYTCIHNVQNNEQLLKFQDSWYKIWPWLHYDTNLTAVVCFTCSKYQSNNTMQQFKTKYNCFITK